MSRAALLDSYYLLSCALVLTLFLFQKGQGFFPSLPIAALLRRRLGGGGTTVARVGMFSCGLADSARPPTNRFGKIMMIGGASRRACCPTAVCIHQVVEI